MWSRQWQLVICELVAIPGGEGILFPGGYGELEGDEKALVLPGSQELVGVCWHRGRGNGTSEGPCTS